MATEGVVTVSVARAGLEDRVAAEAETGAESGAAFESGAAVASTETKGVFSGTGAEDSEGGTNGGAGVDADTVCVGVGGTCAGPEAGAVAEGGDEAAAGWGVG